MLGDQAKLAKKEFFVIEFLKYEYNMLTLTIVFNLVCP